MTHLITSAHLSDIVSRASPFLQLLVPNDYRGLASLLITRDEASLHKSDPNACGSRVLAALRLLRQTNPIVRRTLTCFERELAIASGRLVWAGDVVRTPKPKRQPKPPAAPGEQGLLQREIGVEDEWKSNGGQERVRVIVTHPRSGTELVWKSEDRSFWADSQSVRALETAQVDGCVRVDFVMDTSECGDKHAFDVSLFVKLGAEGIEWAK